MSQPPTKTNSKGEHPYKAFSIYKSFDDISIKNAEINESKPQKKQISNYKFDKSYADSVSITPIMPSPIPSPQGLPNLHKPKKVPKKPTTRSVATSPIFIKKEDYTEFFDWLFNGSEDDIDPTEIERMLFKAKFPKKSF